MNNLIKAQTILLFFYYSNCFSQKEGTLIKNNELKLNYIYHKDVLGMNPTYFFDFIIYKNGNKSQVIKNIKAYPKAYFEDINFDGILDIRISKGASRNPYNAYWYFYVYNTKTKKFEHKLEYDEILRPKYDKEKKEITSIHYEEYGKKQVVKKFKVSKDSVIKFKEFSVYNAWEVEYLNQKIREEFDFEKNTLVRYIKEQEGDISETKETYKLKGKTRVLIERIHTEEYFCGECASEETKTYSEYWKRFNSELKLIKKTKELIDFNINFKFIEHDEPSIYN